MNNDSAPILIFKGYDEGGQLTDAVRRRPYSVLLFDEMEKVSVLNIFHTTPLMLHNIDSILLGFLQTFFPFYRRTQMFSMSCCSC